MGLNELVDKQQALKAKIADLLLFKDEYTNLSDADKFELCSELYQELEIVNNKITEAVIESNDFEELQEVNIRRIDKSTQRELRKIFIAISLAKKANDPLYVKYKRGVELRKANKAAILQKYGTKALQIAMQEQNAKKN